MDYEKIEIDCHSGYKVNESPMSFTYQGHDQDIIEIHDRWYEGNIDPTRPEVSYFKVKTTEGRIFILRYLPLFDAWSGKAL